MKIPKEVYTEQKITALSYWPEGMTWRDYTNACPHCDGPENNCGYADTQFCENEQTGEVL